MKPFFSLKSLAVIGTLIFAGCTTPQVMLDLADKTSGNVALLNNNIGAYAARQQQLVSQRISIDANLADQFAQLAARNQTRIESMRLAGMTNELSLIYGIINASAAAATNQAQLLQVAADQTKLMSDAQLQFDTHTAQLKTVSDSLAELAKDDDLETRLANLAAYAQAVKVSMDAAQTNTSAADMTAKSKTLAERTTRETSNLHGN